MGAVYSLFPSGYVAPTKQTTVEEIVNMPLEEQANFASQSVIMHASEEDFAKKLLDLPAPAKITAEYLASLAAVIKLNGVHADALRAKYEKAAGVSVDTAAAKNEENAAAKNEENAAAKNEENAAVIDENAAVIDENAAEEITVEEITVVETAPIKIVEKVLEKFVPVHYCPNCGKVYRGMEEDEDDEEEDLSSSSYSTDTAQYSEVD